MEAGALRGRGSLARLAGSYSNQTRLGNRDPEESPGPSLAAPAPGGTSCTSSRETSPSAIAKEAEEALQSTLRLPPARPQEEPVLLPMQSAELNWTAQDAATSPKGRLSATAASSPTFGSKSVRAAVGRVVLCGPCGRLEKVRVAEVDSPEAIEHCIRAVFRLPRSARPVVRDSWGCAVPLSAGLVSLKPGDDDAGGAGIYRVEVAKDGGDTEVDLNSSFNPLASRGPSARDLLDTLGGAGDANPAPAKQATPSHHGGSVVDEEEKRLVLSAALHRPAVEADETMARSRHEAPPALSSPVLLPNSVDFQEEPDTNLFTVTSKNADLGSTICKWNTTIAQEDEFEFWCRLSACGVDSPSELASTLRIADDKVAAGNHLFHCSAPFDTSPQHIDAMYDAWADADGLLRKDALRVKLAREHRLALDDKLLDMALERVCEHFHDASSIAGSKVPRIVFASLWQRLILGSACRQGSVSTVPEIVLVEYAERQSLQERILSERAFLFGNQSRSAEVQTMTAAQGAGGRKTRWAWVETSCSELLMRMAVKFFLHPLATEDMLKAAKNGTTKIDRYRHQYFISLEVYALDAKATSTEDMAAAGPTRHRITRSMVSLLATGSPPTRSKPSASRDWLLSVIGCTDKRSSDNLDPLDCFATDQVAARKVLQSIRDDLQAHKRQREYQADFLLYSVIDRAASELTPIYNAYGRRLRWLQARLDAQPRGVPKTHVDEVSRVRHELQELRQWVGQIKGVVHHLECDCGSPADDGSDEAPWRFGADARGHGQSMQVFLRHTTYFLDQASDRLSVLDDLARTFTADIERHKSDSMNQALFVLTVATAVFLPAQFLAGVYGMNFVNPDGTSGIPELRMDHGYLFFWVVTGLLLVGLPTLLCLCLRCRRCRCVRRVLPAVEGAHPETGKVRRSQ